MKDKTSVDLVSIRSNILVYCGEFPQLLKNHGGSCIGSLTLQIGKCFKWIGPTLDLNASRQPLSGELFPSVSQLGEELRLIGLDFLNSPGRPSSAEQQIEGLRRQLELLEKIAALEKGDAMSLDRAEIEREWRLFNCVIPACQSATRDIYNLPIIPGRSRTSYFYRKMAIAFRRDMLFFSANHEMRETFKRLAISYLRQYRKMKGGAS